MSHFDETFILVVNIDISFERDLDSNLLLVGFNHDSCIIALVPGVFNETCPFLIISIKFLANFLSVLTRNIYPYIIF